MSKPNPPKEAKPKDEEKSPKLGGVIVNVITTTLICAIFLGLNYKMVSDITKKNNVTNSEQTVEEEVVAEEIFKGYIFNLGDFTMNLADTSPKAFLKAQHLSYLI